MKLENIAYTIYLEKDDEKEHHGSKNQKDIHSLAILLLHDRIMRSKQPNSMKSLVLVMVISSSV